MVSHIELVHYLTNHSQADLALVELSLSVSVSCHSLELGLAPTTECEASMAPMTQVPVDLSLWEKERKVEGGREMVVVSLVIPTTHLHPGQSKL